MNVNSTSNNRCPSCHSDQWKSARLVVLEGISHSQGNLTGSMTDPGKLSGRLSDLFLSDRWFSFKHPISLESEGITFTAFAESVKAVLVVEGQKIPDAVRPKDPPQPKKPAAAQSIGWFNKVRPGSEPVRPTAPTEPVFPSPPVPVYWMKRLFLNYVWMFMSTLILLPIGYFSSFFFDDARIARINDVFSFAINPLRDVLPLEELHLDQAVTGRILLVIMTSIPILVWLIIEYAWKARGVNDSLQLAYEKRVEAIRDAHKQAEKDFEIALERFEKERSQYFVNIEKAEKQKQDVAIDAGRYEKELEIYNSQMEAYRLAKEENQRLYNGEIYRVERARSLLWDRMRVCTRCGNAYLGP